MMLMVLLCGALHHINCFNASTSTSVIHFFAKRFPRDVVHTMLMYGIKCVPVFLQVTATLQPSQEPSQTDSWSSKTGNEPIALSTTPSSSGSGNQLVSMPKESGINKQYMQESLK